MLRRSILAGAIFYALVGAAWAEALFVSDTVNRIHYDVSGSSLRELRNEMNRKGPRGYWAYTKTNWRWDGQCNMTFWATITMPRLVDRDRLSAYELRKWDRMIDALWEHEMGHVEIGREWAGAIKKADCREAAVKRIDRIHGTRDAEFDRRTRHGRTTGVRLD